MKKKKRLQRELNRRGKSSKNRSKTKLKLAQLEARISNTRNDTHHKATTDINVKGMVKNHKLARHLSDQAFGEFRQQIGYKADWYNSKVIYVDKFFPSSKTCNACGYIKKDLKLSERVFVCSRCGHKDDRDINAAKNIRDHAVVV